MAATFAWNEDNGTQTGSPTKGTTRGAAPQVDWKNTDDIATAYTASPITAGNRSYDKWQFGVFTGTYNQISAGLFAHTIGTLGTGVTLKGPPACTGDGSRLLYTTPATSDNTNLTNAFHNADGQTPVAIGSGVTVSFGITGPEATGKATSTTSANAFTNYLTTQLSTTGSAAAGNTTPVTLTLQYDEN